MNDCINWSLCLFWVINNYNLAGGVYFKMASQELHWGKTWHIPDDHISYYKTVGIRGTFIKGLFVSHILFLFLLSIWSLFQKLLTFAFPHLLCLGVAARCLWWRAGLRWSTIHCRFCVVGCVSVCPIKWQIKRQKWNDYFVDRDWDCLPFILLSLARDSYCLFQRDSYSFSHPFKNHDFNSMNDQYEFKFKNNYFGVFLAQTEYRQAIFSVVVKYDISRDSTSQRKFHYFSRLRLKQYQRK